MKVTWRFASSLVLGGIFIFGAQLAGAETATDPYGRYVTQVKAGKFEPGQWETISIGALADKIEKMWQGGPEFVLVDLRNKHDFMQGAVPEAVNIPLQKLSFYAGRSFQKEDEIVFYGYSSGDKASVNAVILLAHKGYKRLFLLEGGWAAWRERDL